LNLLCTIHLLNGGNGAKKGILGNAAHLS